MTVIQLECFMELNKQRNFSKAAANLYLSQPTLSRHIQALEEELRATLFIRSNNTIRLTAIGEALCPTLERLYHEFQTASVEMREIVDRQTGLFRIGVSASLQLQNTERRAIQQLKTKHPNTKVRITHLNFNQIYNALMNGSVDILFALDAFMPPSDKVYARPIYTDTMCLAVPSNHPNADLLAIEQSQIKQYFPDLELFLLDAGDFEPDVQSDLKSDMEDYDNDSIFVKVPEATYGMEDIMLMVNGGIGCTCVNEHSILQNNRMVTLIPLVNSLAENSEPKTIRVTVYWIKKNYNPLLKSFLSILKEQYQPKD